jgi:hypothetical protein
MLVQASSNCPPTKFNSFAINVMCPRCVCSADGHVEGYGNISGYFQVLVLNFPACKLSDSDQLGDGVPFSFELADIHSHIALHTMVFVSIDRRHKGRASVGYDGL